MICLSPLSWSARQPPTVADWMRMKGITPPHIIEGHMRKIEKLQELCAAMYQIAGASGLDAKVLDMLASAASGKEFGDPMSLLPYESSNIVDAERYRWIRANSSQIVFHTKDGMYCFTSDDLREYEEGQELLDSSIDIAMKEDW